MSAEFRGAGAAGAEIVSSQLYNTHHEWITIQRAGGEPQISSQHWVFL